MSTVRNGSEGKKERGKKELLPTPPYHRGRKEKRTHFPHEKKKGKEGPLNYTTGRRKEKKGGHVVRLFSSR